MDAYTFYCYYALMYWGAKFITIVGGVILLNQVDRYGDVLNFQRFPATEQEITRYEDPPSTFAVRSLSPISFISNEVTQRPPAVIAPITLVNTATPHF